MEYECGDVVLSKAGRDKGRLFVVLEVKAPDYVRIADGMMRKTDNPKPKKMKHIQKTNKTLPEIANKIHKGERIYDRELQKAIRSLMPSEQA